MMSTIGLMPVIAAPTPRPVNPASEIGVSMTREGPNSCTRPVSTLKAVPASATSSPSSTTRGSRRISSAIASLTASPNVSSRTAAAVSTCGIDIFGHFVDGGIRCVERQLHRAVHLSGELRIDPIARVAVRDAVVDEMATEDRDGIALGDPPLLLVFGAIVVAADVPDVVPAEA